MLQVDDNGVESISWKHDLVIPSILADDLEVAIAVESYVIVVEHTCVSIIIQLNDSKILLDAVIKENDWVH